MFRLFKQRNFSDIFNDTFGFLRATGKNYFRNYIIVNSPFLILLLVLTYFMGKIFYEAAISSFGSTQSNRVIEEFFDDNLAYFFTTLGVMLVIFVIMMMLNYSYPVIYMKLYEDGKEPQTADIIKELKRCIGKIMLFVLLWFISFLPALVLIGFVFVFLIVLIIGIPFAILLIAAFFSWMTLAFYNYLNTDDGYFESFSKGLSMMTAKFWTHAGSTAIFVIMIYIVQFAISLIPNIFGMASMFTPEGSEESLLSVMGIVMLISFIITTIANYLLGNLIYINQGMIYYSYRDERENRSAHTEIDLIGSNDE
jgi:hypothetical protein